MAAKAPPKKPLARANRRSRSPPPPARARRAAPRAAAPRPAADDDAPREEDEALRAWLEEALVGAAPAAADTPLQRELAAARAGETRRRAAAVWASAPLRAAREAVAREVEAGRLGLRRGLDVRCDVALRGAVLDLLGCYDRAWRRSRTRQSNSWRGVCSKATATPRRPQWPVGFPGLTGRATLLRML